MKSDFVKWFESKFGPRPKIPVSLPARTDTDLLALAQQGAQAQLTLKARHAYDGLLEAAKLAYDSKR